MGTTLTEMIASTLKGNVWHIEICRPEKRNALTMLMFAALAESLAVADGKQEVRAILVSGKGTCFCAGHDLLAFSAWPQAPEDPVPRFLYAIAKARKPVVLAVHGAAAGVGVTWMLHADWSICTPSTVLCLPFINMGIAPEAGSSILLARAIGSQRARQLLMGGESFTGTQAHAWGLATELAETADVLELAMQRAEFLAAKDTATLMQIKNWLHPADAFTAQIEAEIYAINQAVQQRLAATEITS